MRDYCHKRVTSAGSRIRWPILLLAVLLVACSSSGPSNEPSYYRPTTAPVTYAVMYRVAGSPGAKADLTYRNAGGNTEQRSDVFLPWTQTYQMQHGDFMYVSAQIKSTGRIKCEISVNYKVVQEAESNGRFVIANCSGSAGR